MVGEVDAGVAQGVGRLGEAEDLVEGQEGDCLVEPHAWGDRFLLEFGQGPTGADGANVTGMCFTPLMKLDRSRCTSPSRRMSGMRSRSRSNITMISMRARFAPRQKCGPPPPKAMWLFGERVMSNVSGFSNAASSRLAEVCQKTTLSPSLICCSCSSMSPVAVRRKCMTGVT